MFSFFLCFIVSWTVVVSVIVCVFSFICVTLSVCVVCFMFDCVDELFAYCYLCGEVIVFSFKVIVLFLGCVDLFWIVCVWSSKEYVCVSLCSFHI